MASERPSSQSDSLHLKKLLMSREKQSSEQLNYIIELQQKIVNERVLVTDLQRMKINQKQMRDLLKIKVDQMELQKNNLFEQLKLTQELLMQAEKQISKLRRLYEQQIIKNKERQTKKVQNSRISQNSERDAMDQNFIISKLTKQIDIMKQLHLEQIAKVKKQYDGAIHKVIHQKSQLERFMRLKEDERIRVKTPTFKDRNFSEDQYSKQLQNIINKKVQQYQDIIKRKDEDIVVIEEQIQKMEEEKLEVEGKYMQMTQLFRNALQEIQSLKGEKDILQKTLDFSKKIAEQQRNQFNKMLQIQKQNSSIQLQSLRQSLRVDLMRFGEMNVKLQDNNARHCMNSILTKLKVVGAFMSDFKKYYYNMHSEMKQYFETLVVKIFGFLDEVNLKSSKGASPQYQILIQKYKTILKQKDKEILELRKSKNKYSRNIEYLNKILVDD